MSARGNISWSISGLRGAGLAGRKYLILRTLENTQETVDEFKIPWKQILSVPESVPEAYGFNYIPYIILLSPDGTILERDLRGEAVREAVKKYLITK